MAELSSSKSVFWNNGLEGSAAPEVARQFVFFERNAYLHRWRKASPPGNRLPPADLPEVVRSGS
jgi:hypothetical protein